MDLFTVPLKAIVERNGIDPKEVDDVVVGCVTETDEQGTNIARGAVLAAGWPVDVPGVTLNRFCGSGQQAVNFAAQAVKSGAQDLVVAGGVESMTRVPMGKDMGPLPRSLMEKYDLVPQGLSAEMIADKWSFSREQVDRFALWSQAEGVAGDPGGPIQQEPRARAVHAQRREQGLLPGRAPATADRPWKG